MGEACSLCGRENFKLLNAIVDKEIKRICDVCASVDDSIIVIAKPTEQQLREAEKSFTVYERLRRMAGLKLHEDELQSRDASRRREAQVNLAKLAAIRDDEGFMKRQEERRQLNLADDFNEQIQNARNLKGLTQKQLADALVESEDTVMMLERGIIPSDSENTIKKIEQYLRLDLRKKPEEKRFVDFKSPNITIGDLQRMRQEMFGGGNK
jgi:ribosome-binding protein aMBF1 (putative translation factor)